MRERAALDTVQRLSDELMEAQRVAKVGGWRWDAETDTLQWSSEMHRILGLEASRVPTLEGFLSRVHPDDHVRLARVAGGAVRTPEEFQYDFRIVTPDGEVRHVHARGALATGDDGAVQHARGTCQDTTDRMRLEAEIRRRAFRDGLTDQPNRALFRDRLEHTFPVHGRSGGAISLLDLDLDGFERRHRRHGTRAHAR